MTDRSKATFLVLLIFTSGVLFGGILAFFLVQPRFAGPGGAPNRRPPAVRNQAPGGMDELSDRLGFDASQRTQLRRILRESRQSLNALNQEVNRRHRSIRRSTRERIQEILDPDQRKKFEEFLSAREQRRPRPVQNPRQRGNPLRRNRQ